MATSGIDLLGADHRERDDRHLGAQRRGHEAAAAEPLQLVALGVGLADPLEALRPDADQLAAAQHPLGVLAAGQGGATLAGQRARPPASGRPGRRRAAAAHRPAWSWITTIVISPSTGTRAGVVGDDQGATLGRDVLDAADLDPEPLLRDRPQRGDEEALGDLGVEAVLVDVVVAAHPAAQERQEARELRLPLVAEQLAGRRAGTRPASHRRGCRPTARGPRRTPEPAARRRPCRPWRSSRLPRWHRLLPARWPARRRGTAGGAPSRTRSWRCRRRRLREAERRLAAALAAARAAAGPDRDDLGVTHGGLPAPERARRRGAAGRPARSAPARSGRRWASAPRRSRRTPPRS